MLQWGSRLSRLLVVFRFSSGMCFYVLDRRLLRDHYSYRHPLLAPLLSLVRFASGIVAFFSRIVVRIEFVLSRLRVVLHTLSLWRYIASLRLSRYIPFVCVTFPLRQLVTGTEEKSGTR